MKWPARIAWGAVICLALVAFAAGLIAVWQPANSTARSGWGGTAIICGMAAFLGVMVAIMASEDGSDTDGPCP